MYFVLERYFKLHCFYIFNTALNQVSALNQSLAPPLLRGYPCGTLTLPGQQGGDDVVDGEGGAEKGGHDRAQTEAPPLIVLTP